MRLTQEHRDILVKAVSIAKINGFEISDSFFTDVEVEDQLFDGQNGYYSIIFDHEFWRCLLTEDVYVELYPDVYRMDETPEDVDLVATLNAGNHPVAALVQAKRAVRLPMWQYHIAQVALSEDPLLYIKNIIDQDQT